MTAMQMLGAFNVIANDGAYVAPRLVDATVGPDGTRAQAAGRVPSRRVVSEDTARTDAGHDGQGGLRASPAPAPRRRSRATRWPARRAPPASR